MSNAHACPACGRELDPLRAGQVAILEGQFFYFCDRTCKARYLASREGVVDDAVATAEPPRVAPVPTPTIEPPTSNIIATADAPVEEDGPRSMPIRRWAATEEAPTSLRTEPVDVPRTTSRTPLVAYLAIVAGGLSIGVALVGRSADGARLPLALVACAAAITYGAMVAGRLLVRAAWAGIVVVFLAALCAIAAGILGVPSHVALASFAGVIAACFVGVSMNMARAVEPLDAARAAILGALDVSANAEGRLLGPAEIRPGEVVSIAEGETIPVDGVVASGEATVSPWMQAQTDVIKREGSSVVAGARIVTGSLRVTATWTGVDRAFAKLLVNPRARVERAAPLARTAALLDTRVIPPVALVAGAFAFANGASVLDSFACVVASLAAFGISLSGFTVGLLHARGHVRALGHGAFYRDAEHYDRAGRAAIAVVCARGTVLLGEPEIVAIDGVGAHEAANVLALAAAVATGSSHPFAAAILRAARARSVRADNVRNPVHAGSGATALDAAGERIVLGRRAFLLAERVSVAVADDAVREHESQGRSVLLVARAGRVIGLVALQDGLRAGARAAVQKLHDAHIEPVLLSGEARETCESIGRALDIEHLRPEVAGPERGGEVRALSEGGDVVAVLGHPAADDSALGAADVSVALDAGGASPGEWGVVLASDDVRDGAEALTIPRVVRDRSIRVLAFAVAPGILATLAIAFGLMPLWSAPLLGAVVASATILYAKD